MKRKILTLFLTCLVAPWAAAQQFDVDSISYRVLSPEQQTAEITRVDIHQSDLQLPSQVSYQDNVYTVTSIADWALNDCAEINSIVVPATVTTIGEKAFMGCLALRSIRVESGNPIYDSRDACMAVVRTADNTLVVGGANTEIPQSVTAIGSYAFCSRLELSTMVLPETITSIGEYAFKGCTNLSLINIPDGMRTSHIGEGAFEGCTSLTLPDKIAKSKAMGKTEPASSRETSENSSSTSRSAKASSSTPEEEKKVVLGPRVGVNLASASFSDYSGSTSSRIGFQLGLGVDLNLTSVFGLSTGLFFTQKGYKYSQLASNTTASASMIQLPVLLAVRFGPWRTAQVRIGVGPYAAFAVGGKIKTEFPASNDAIDRPFSDSFGSLDAGITAGVGATFARHITLDVRYELGLSKYKNRNLGITLGYNF